MTMSNGWVKAYWLLKELGIRPLFYLSAYRLGIRSGYYRWRTPVGGRRLNRSPRLRADIFVLPETQRLVDWNRLRGEDGLAEAEEILSGRVRLFGGQPQPMNLKPPNPTQHWSLLREDEVEGDIKPIWEMARLGWVFLLGRAFCLTGDERYSRCFWHYWEQFVEDNPVNAGENWLSAQEAALRLISLAFAAQVFEHSRFYDENRKQSIATAVVHHARRIEATLAYARAQNNNHLFSEAVGLLVAAHLLPEWHEARRWRKTGWQWFEWTVLHQIESDGEYIQHSVNYHRLMLTLALLVHRIAQIEQHPLPEKLLVQLRLAAGWLYGVMDETSGEALHLGHHDGAHLIPLGGTIEDYRPIVQAAMAAFCSKRALPTGGWDELACWLGLNPAELPQASDPPLLRGIRRLGNRDEWMSLRAHHFTSRPAHADQLQTELWWRGHRLVCDPGTYAYNLPPPWENGLALAEVHNVPLINQQQPMWRAGKFLWLRWDQAHFPNRFDVDGKSMGAVRMGYRRLGVHQERWVSWVEPGHWQVVDLLSPLPSKEVTGKVSLNWLLRDGDWKLEGRTLMMDYGRFELWVYVASQPEQNMLIRIVRAGQVLQGDVVGKSTTVRWGWFSPTYLVRKPAISLWVELDAQLPIELKTDFKIHPK